MQRQIAQMDLSEMKAYILEIQSTVQNELSKGTNIDDFLDRTTIFDDFENIIPEAEFGIFVLTILNGLDLSDFTKLLIFNDFIKNLNNHLNNYIFLKNILL